MDNIMKLVGDQGTHKRKLHALDNDIPCSGYGLADTISYLFKETYIHFKKCKKRKNKRKKQHHCRLRQLIRRDPRKITATLR